MLYRLRPQMSVEWSGLPADAPETAAEYNTDLDGADWKPAEDHPFTPDLLRIALRYGTATRAGIVFDAGMASDLGRADDLRRSQRDLDATFAKHPELDPGNTEEIRQSTEHEAQFADQDLAEVLAVPAKAALEQHWRQLGGVLPD